MIKLNNKKYHTVGTVPKFNRKIVVGGKMYFIYIVVIVVIW